MWKGDGLYFLSSSVMLVEAFIVAAVAQDGGGQGEGLQDFIDDRNPQLVGTCIIVAPGVLATCQLSENLVTSGEVYLASIRFGILTCDSSLSVNFTLSDGTMVNNVANRIQCDTPVTLGQLTVVINVAVFMYNVNFIGINTSVSEIFLGW